MKVLNIMFQKCCIFISSNCVWLGSCNNGNKFWNLLGVGGTLGSWETENLRTKFCPKCKMSCSVIHLLLTVPKILLVFNQNCTYVEHFSY